MFAVLRIPGFALQAILRVEPTALSARPVVLLAAGRHGATIALCSEAALAAGVRPGHSVPRAQARCPHLVVRTAQPALEQEAESALLAAGFAITPQVELTSPGVCTLGLEHLPSHRRAPAVDRALGELAALRLNATAGFAATPLLALYAARCAAPGRVVTGDRAFLAPLPLATAEPPPELAPILSAWGIHTLGQLTALPKSDVAQRLGREGLALWERAAGATTRPLNVVAPPRTFTAAYAGEHEMETLEPLLFILRRFVDRLALELGNAHQAALAVELELNLADDTRHTRSIRLPEPVTNPELLFRALQTHLETVRTAAPIIGVQLRIEPGRSQVRQQGLFDGGLRDPHGFADTLARVMALVGSDRVGRPVNANTHRPDSFTLEAPPPALAPLPDDFTHPPRGLPLRRYRPPVPAQVELAGRAPAYVWTAALQGIVSATAGPWHNSGDWWEADRHWQHEEWDVEFATGGVYRLRRTAAGWFLEGEYD